MFILLYKDKADVVYKNVRALKRRKVDLNSYFTTKQQGISASCENADCEICEHTIAEEKYPEIKLRKLIISHL